jgi:flagellar biosynthesis protein FliQ
MTTTTRSTTLRNDLILAIPPVLVALVGIGVSIWIALH